MKRIILGGVFLAGLAGLFLLLLPDHPEPSGSGAEDPSEFQDVEIVLDNNSPPVTKDAQEATEVVQDGGALILTPHELNASQALEGIFPFEKNAHPQVAVLVRAHIAQAMGLRDASENDLRESLRRLRQFPQEVVEIVDQEYDRQPEQGYNSRWQLVQTLRELNNLAAKPFFLKVLNTPIPTEKSNDLHLFSTVIHETALRTTAIDGLELLAVSGNAEVRDEILNQATTNPSRSVRIEAILAYMDLFSNREEAKKILRQELSAKDQGILEIVRIGPGDLEMIQKFVSDNEETTTR